MDTTTLDAHTIVDRAVISIFAILLPVFTFTVEVAHIGGAWVSIVTVGVLGALRAACASLIWDAYAAIGQVTYFVRAWVVVALALEG